VKRNWQRLLFTLIVLLSSTGATADYPLEIIELKGRHADEIIPIIKPFVSPDGSIAGINNQLIIRTSRENMQEIRSLLQRIDRPPQTSAHFSAPGCCRRWEEKWHRSGRPCIRR